MFFISKYKLPLQKLLNENDMKTIKLNDLLKDQVRQIKNEIESALKLNDYAKAQELIFEMIKIQAQIK